MPRDLFRVRRVDAWTTRTPDLTLFVIKGETVDERPRSMALKTFKPFQAALCERVSETDQLVWVTWKDGRPEPFSADKQADLVACELDDTKFQHREAV